MAAMHWCFCVLYALGAEKSALCSWPNVPRTTHCFTAGISLSSRIRFSTIAAGVRSSELPELL
jgi:hypothetical protein